MSMIFFWTILYGLAYTIPRVCISGSWAVPLSMGVYTLTLVTWLIRTGRAGYVRLQAARAIRYRDLPDLLSLLVLPACNLPMTAAPALSAIALMVFASAAEELLFRGVLLRYFQKWGNLRSILAAAILFALFHGVNLISGSGTAAVLLQMTCAAGAGFLYGAMTLKWNSILPAMAGHALTNITGIASAAQPLELLLGSAFCLLWGIQIYKSTNT